MRRRRTRIHEVEEIPLQITSLADIMIIVLIFLLKSYSSEMEQDIAVPADIRLPVVSKGGSSKEDLRIEISESVVKVGGTVIAPLRNYRFDPSDLSREWSPVGTSRALTAALGRENRALAATAAAEAKETKENTRPIWVFADRKVPYRTLQTVMASAAINGFTDVRLAVVKEE